MIGSQPNKMEEVGLKYQTDKITHHEYHKIYDFFLKPLYNCQGSILEIGVERGKSIRMWQDLFPQAFIYGLDIGCESTGARHQVLKCDQSNVKELLDVRSLLASQKVFFINDDGSHIPEHQLLTFNTLFPILQEGGVYIIEDIETSYWTKNGLYGYPTRYGYKHPNSIIEIFKDVADTVNAEFSKKKDCRVKHTDWIGSITFSKNCIIITKHRQTRRPYRFETYL